jgi:hypothetical protein
MLPIQQQMKMSVMIPVLRPGEHVVTETAVAAVIVVVVGDVHRWTENRESDEPGEHGQTPKICIACLNYIQYNIINFCFKAHGCFNI